MSESVILLNVFEEFNIKNGLPGMNRDLNMNLIKFFKNDADIIEVYFLSLI
jgi:hypothetical protein